MPPETKLKSFSGIENNEWDDLIVVIYRQVQLCMHTAHAGISLRKYHAKMTLVWNKGDLSVGRERRDEKRNSSPSGSHKTLPTSKDYNSPGNWLMQGLEHKQLHMAPSSGKMTSWRWTGHPTIHSCWSTKLRRHWTLQPNSKIHTCPFKGKGAILLMNQ